MDGAVREAEEELGLRVEDVGGEVYRRRHVFRWNDKILDQRERFFVLRVGERFDPAPSIGADRLQAEGVLEHRWWTADDIDVEQGVDFAPRHLARIVRGLVADVGEERE